MNASSIPCNWGQPPARSRRRRRRPRDANPLGEQTPASRRGATRRIDPKEVAFDVIDLVDTLGVGPISYDAWRARFARGRSTAAVKQAWARLKRGLRAERYTLAPIKDGKYSLVVLKPDAKARAERFLDRHAKLPPHGEDAQ